SRAGGRYRWGTHPVVLLPALLGRVDAGVPGERYHPTGQDRRRAACRDRGPVGGGRRPWLHRGSVTTAGAGGGWSVAGRCPPVPDRDRSRGSGNSSNAGLCGRSTVCVAGTATDPVEGPVRGVASVSRKGKRAGRQDPP